MTCPFEQDAGSYVLGALSPEDRVAFERHLAECDGCARDVREFAGLPGLLARIPVEVVDPQQLPMPVPDTLLPAVVRRIRRSQRRRGWVASGLVAAAAVVALGAGVAIAGGGDDPAPRATAPVATTAAAEALQPVGSSPVTGWVSLTSVGWGTRLDLTCEYRNPPVGGPYGDDSVPTYTMVVTHTDGTTEQVASWKGLPGKELHLTAATSASRGDIANVVVEAADGRPVLTLQS